MPDRVSSLRRLLCPKTIAMVGGREVARSIVQCDRIGFAGTIWPVHPTRTEIEGRECFPDLESLPGVPDAAFVAIPGEATVAAIEHLALIGTSGAVCYASGFAEVGEHGARLQKRLERAIGSMALIGPNCYGMLNYLDGVALWPDEHGGRRCDRGAAVISQSGNISINLTMQRRATPLAYVISAGNMAGIKTHDFIRCMLDDDRVTAIGLYLEGIPDAFALSQAAIAALDMGKPIVVLESGYSKVGSMVTMSHSSSMTGQEHVNRAFYDRYGIVQVRTIPEFLETLKFLSVNGPIKSKTIATVSCSGGEAAMMADHAESSGLEFSEFTDDQAQKLKHLLGDRVVVSNPLDYHTYIWGMPDKQAECFQAVFEGHQAVTVMAIDYPSEGLCDCTEWDDAIKAVITAQCETQANVVVMASLHENLPQRVQDWLAQNGIAPMLGLDECFKAILNAELFARRRAELHGIVPIAKLARTVGDEESLTEYAAKRELSRYGIAVPEGVAVHSIHDAVDAAVRLGFPVAVKASSSEIVHKTELGAVRLNLKTEQDVHDAAAAILAISGEILVEKMAPAPYLDMLVSVRCDERFGLLMVIGAGGTLAELFADFEVLLFPIDELAIDQALARLKVGKLLNHYRGKSGDVQSLRRTLVAIADFAMDRKETLIELEVNPLHVYEFGNGVMAVDALFRIIKEKQNYE